MIEPVAHTSLGANIPPYKPAPRSDGDRIAALERRCNRLESIAEQTSNRLADALRIIEGMRTGRHQE
jgi:hypothetical protein